MSCECKTPAPQSADDGACSGTEVFALRVLGPDMQPEFNDGDIVVIEPGGASKPGSFVLAREGGGWSLRQLLQNGPDWSLHTLNPGPGEPASRALADLSTVEGVVIQKAVPGRRKLSKFYL